MNEEHSISSSTSQQGANETLGQILKRAREVKNLTITDVATALHLKNSMVTDIEADDFTHISNATYLRGYVKNLARYVEADQQKIAQCLARQVPVVQEPSMQSFSRKTVRQRRDTRYHLVTWLVVIALLGLMVFWWLQTSAFFDNGVADFSKPTAEEVAAEKSESAAVASVATQLSGSSTVPAEMQQLTSDAPATGSATDSAGTDVDSTAAVVPVSSPTSQSLTNGQAQQSQAGLSNQPQLQAQPSQSNQVVSAGTANPAATVTTNSEPQTAAEILAADAQLRAPKQAEEPAPVTVAVPGQGEVKASFSADCWIQIKDADGKVLVSEVRKPGQDVTLTGKAPLSVILGAPGAVTLNFDGQQVNLAQFPVGKVARFSLPLNG